MTLSQQLKSCPERYVELALNPWKSNIVAGNESFAQGDFLAAIDKYQTAWTISVHSLEYFSCSIMTKQTLSALEHCYPAVVVSAHNLADCYLALGKTAKACHQLSDVNTLMMKLHEYACVEVSTIAQHHYDKTRQALMHFAAHHAHFPELITEINFNINASEYTVNTVH